MPDVPDDVDLEGLIALARRQMRHDAADFLEDHFEL